MDSKETKKHLKKANVTFHGATYPPYGWCVLLFGSGSDRCGYVSSLIPIDCMMLDADDYKYFYMRMSDLEGDSITTKDGHVYDIPDEVLIDPTFKNPVFSTYIDEISGSLVSKVRSQLSEVIADADSGDLPNICFDMTDMPGRHVTDINQIINVVKPLGYKVSAVWIINETVEVAKDIGDESAAKDKSLDFMRLDISLEMSQLLRDRTVLSLIDEAWALIPFKITYKDRNETVMVSESIESLLLNTISDVEDLPDTIERMIDKKIKSLQPRFIDITVSFSPGPEQINNPE